MAAWLSLLAMFYWIAIEFTAVFFKISVSLVQISLVFYRSVTFHMTIGLESVMFISMLRIEAAIILNAFWYIAALAAT